MPFGKCPICGGDVVEKEVEKLLKGGTNTATLTVKAEVCLRCGEWLYSQETVQRFEEIRRKLERKDTKEFEVIGQLFHVRN
jgi:YgiT-type zinc finger domain-containing protein